MTKDLETDPRLEELLKFIRDERGFDFTGYKRPTLTRRIRKRMSDVGIDDVEAYKEYLQFHEREFPTLFDTILINVTEFFRDPPAWRHLGDEILPRLVEARRDRQIRAWSAGAASGEEAYTLAMLLADALGEDAFRDSVKIYATDVDEAALAAGRRSIYSADQVAKVPPNLRQKYFEDNHGGFSFRADLRRCVIFGRHDLVKDPPISRVDLLLARNTLMYFDVETQAKILSSFYFALAPDGYLFLGKSESLATRTTLFTPVDLQRRIFVKSSRLDEDPPALPSAPALVASAAPSDGELRETALVSVPLAYLVLDAQHRLRFVSQQARSAFNLSSKDIGRPFRDFDVSFRPLELRSRIEQATVQGHALSIPDVEWVLPGRNLYYDVGVHPLTSQAGSFAGIAIAFLDVTKQKALQRAHEEAQHELETAYEELQSTNEELETTNEELQSTNEELETTNEELQSTNEELETMNEELQSTNDELGVTNDRLELKTIELDRANALLEAILGSFREGVVVVDQELRVVEWNTRSEDLWGLRRDEVVGEHLMNLDIGLPLERLRRPLRAVMSGGEAVSEEIEAVSRRGRQIRCRVELMPLPAAAGSCGATLVVQEESF